MQEINLSTPLKSILENSMNCGQCGHCCRYGSGALIGEDVANIARHLKISEEELKEKYLEQIEKFHTVRFRPKLQKKDLPYGECIFLQDNKCKIHEVKPLQCKVCKGCDEGEDLWKWFMVNYFVKKDDPESIRQYAVYLKDNKPIPGAELKDLIPDEIMLKKILDYGILRSEDLIEFKTKQQTKQNQKE